MRGDYHDGVRRFFLALLFCGACKNVYPTLMHNPGDGGNNHTSGGTTGIGGISDGGNATADMDSGMAPVPRGLILLHSGSASLVRATFGDNGCSTSSVSGCTITTCAPADLAMTMRAAGVGTINVTGAASPITLMPQADGSYLPASFAFPIWGMNAKLTVSATGGEHPAFSTMLDGTTAVVVTNPLTGGFIDIARNADFDVSWTGTSPGQVTVEIAAATKLLRCSYTVVANSGLVPRQALSQLPAGSGQMNLYVDSSATVDQGIEVRARVSAEDNTGNAFAIGVSLQ
jgi:hypothetical protein